MKTNENELRMKNEALAKLAAKAKTGDQAAFTELYNRTSNDLFRCIRAMTRDEDLTWDIQQDSYLRAFQSLDKLENNEAFFPWLRRIAVNVTADRMKQRLPLTFTELTVEDDGGMPELPDLNPANQPELSLDRKETSRLVQEILSKLPEEQQLIVGMRYYDELSVKEIAGLLNISDGAVKAQLFHGRKKVETAVRALEKQGIKLYGLSPVAFLVALMRRAEPAAASGARQAAVKAAVAKVSADAVAATAVPVAAKTFGQVLAGRVLAGALAVALIGGGIWGGAKLLKSKQRYNPYQPTTVVTSERLAGVETPEELTETGEALPVVTDPVVTEPAATEAVTTEAVEPVRAANQCGEHLTWSFDPSSGRLTVEGSGPMDDYAAPEDAPWYSLRSQINSIELPDEITTIGNNAFAGCTALECAWFQYGGALRRIGDHAFDGCVNYVPVNSGYYFTQDDGNPLEIGSYAYRGCRLYSMICPYYVTSIGTGAFSDCDFAELWIINKDYTIGAAAADTSVTIYGLPDSTAARYAAQNAHPFEPMADIGRDTVVDLLEQGVRMRYDGLIPYGSQYILRVARADYLTATEAEIQQAAQTGTIVLAGIEYPYADSVEEAAEWSSTFTDPSDADWNGVNDDNVVGWIHISQSQDFQEGFYMVVRRDNHYIFNLCSRVGQFDPYLNEYTDLGWLWLDADNPYSDLGMITPIREANNHSYERRVQSCELILNDEGQIVPCWREAGRR